MGESFVINGNIISYYQFRGFIQQSEEKCGNSYLVVMIPQAHLMKENRFVSAEGKPYFLP